MREIFRLAPARGWALLSRPYVVEELLTNLPNLRSDATAHWARLRATLQLVDDVLTIDQAAVFEPAEDRPILFTALAWSDVLLTLDRKDFGSMLGRAFYGLAILTPGGFLHAQRTPA